MDGNDTDNSSRDDKHYELHKQENEIETITKVSSLQSADFDPRNFPNSIKARVLITGFVCAFNSSLGTSMPSGAYEAISQHFSVTSKTQLALLNSLNMVGFILGPVLFGPLSECIGRRPVMMVSYLGFVVFMLACSGAPTYAVLLVFRLLCGINAAAPITIIGGLFADILDDPNKRGLSIAVFMLMNTSGALIGPIISGFASRISWRWAFWAASIMASPGIPLVLMLPETFAPVLRAQRIRQRMKACEVLDETALANTMSLDVHKIFLRPFTLIVKEPVLLSSAPYLALAYAILYFMFQIYPVVFQDMYRLPPGVAGLAYLPILVGAGLAVLIFYTYSWWYDRSRKAGKTWAQNEVYRRLPLTCFASPCMVIGLFWLGWTSWKTYSPIVPSLGGLFFGIGFQLIFMSMLNFITDVFRQGSASAHAAASCIRSAAAILVPLAADSMYRNLGIHWASSLLGFLSLAIGIIPFVFIFFGKRLLNRTPET